jgi:hypothetical protein
MLEHLLFGCHKEGVRAVAPKDADAVEHPSRREIILWIANPYIKLRQIANLPQRCRTSAATG